MIKRDWGNGIKYELIEYYQPLFKYLSMGEKQTEKWIIENVKSHWFCIDVGAHVGSITILLAQLCERVYAIEANKEACEMLKKNLMHNCIYNVHVLNAFVRDVFNQEKRTAWFAGTSEHAINCEVETDSPVVTLDSLAFDKVDLIKIDTDGWDYEILQGAIDTIKTHRPVILIELNKGLKRRDHTFDEVIHWIGEQNYAIVDIFDRSMNWLLIPREKYETSNR